MCCKVAQANIASKNDITNFIKKTDFDDKLKNLKKKVTSIKTKHTLIENELNDFSKNLKYYQQKD